MQKVWNVIVVGAGPAGTTAAKVDSTGLIYPFGTVQRLHHHTAPFAW